MTQQTNEQLIPAPCAALQQQEVTTLQKRGGESSNSSLTDKPAAAAAVTGLSYAHTTERETRFHTMPLKNGNTVGVERRMDLASLFCMIGRHGPAVALAVIAMMSVLAGFIIYRTVRGKRRKKATEEQAAADGDGDGGSTGEEERDAPVESTGKKDPPIMEY